MSLKSCPLSMSRLLCLLSLCLALPAAGEGAGVSGSLAVRTSMLLHTDLRLPEHGSGLESAVVLRRARLLLDATVAEWIDARLILGDLPVRERQFIKDAWLDFRFRPWLQLRVGKLKTPFGHEWLMTSSNHLDFIERSLLFNGLVPQYALGAAVHGKAWGGQGEYWAGYVNGEPRSDGKLEGADQRMLVARLSYSPLSGVLLGASATHSVGGRDRPWAPRWSAPTGYKLLEAEPVSVWTPRSRAGAEAVFRRGPVSVKSEYVYLDALGDWRGSGEGTQGLWAQGFYASATWVVTGEEKTAKGVSPQSPFKPLGASPGLGAWELGIRYGLVESNLGVGVMPKGSEALTQRLGLHEATLGLNWYVNANMRWMVNGSRYALGQGPAALLKGSAFQEVLIRMQLFL